MKVICYTSKKGGTGKTTSCFITGLIFSQLLKKRVLFIDLDSSYALSSLFFEADDIDNIIGNTIYEAIKGIKLFDDVIIKLTENIHVIPSILEFEEIHEWSRIGKEFILRKELENIKDQYDYVILDTPGDLRTETVLGLVAADIVVITAQLEKMDTRAIDFTLDKINNQVTVHYNPTLQNIYILPTKYNYHNRTVHDFNFVNLLNEYPEMLLYNNSKGAKDYIKIPYSSKISQQNCIGYDNNIKLKHFPEYIDFVEKIK